MIVLRHYTPTYLHHAPEQYAHDILTELRFKASTTHRVINDAICPTLLPAPNSIHILLTKYASLPPFPYLLNFTIQLETPQ